MKLLQLLNAIACILAAPVTNAGEKPAGKAPTDAKKSAETAIRDYNTAEQLKAMPRCKATVEHIGPAWLSLKTTDGKQFIIGNAESKPEVWQFLKTLQGGDTYEFPGAFLDY